MDNPTTLFSAATAMELSSLFPKGAPPLEGAAGSSWRTERGAHLLVTGVGSIESAAQLSRYLAEHREVKGVLQVGIAGAYARAGAGEALLQRGALLRVVSDHAADAGAWDGAQLIAASTLGFPSVWSESPHYFNSFPIASQLDSLQKVAGATVEAASGSTEQAERRANSGAEIETLEGAVLFAVAQAWGLGALQLRAISNLCGPRDRSSWKIDRALAVIRRFFEGHLSPCLRE